MEKSWSMIERGKTDGEIGFYRRAGRVAGDGNRFFCVCMSGENGSLLYTTQREFGPGCGLVSSAQRVAFLSRAAHGEGHLQSPLTLDKRKARQTGR